ncbi:MAG: hypothetical protein IPG96_13065 [Proteobacteria bacterium]|nr:hypothetical protein [Pseudomonadota bacterium]
MTQPPALPTCSASISPGSGNTNTNFTITWSSNGSSCTWALDGVNQGAVPCSGSAPNSRFTVGNHTVTLRTTGPGGTTQCNSNSVSVTPPPALPTCSASISPGSGNTDTNFTIRWSSNGSSCTWAFDGVNQGGVPCSGTIPTTGGFAVGNHVVTLRTTGPGGTTQCNSNTVSVTQAPALPTCSASISPGSGNTNTNFTITWSSNGSSCTWALDGINQGGVPCSGSAPNSRFTVGNHYVTLRTTGPGGTTQCNSNAILVR